MTSASSILRSLLIYSICVPLALLLGYILAMSGDQDLPNVILIVGLILFVLMSPLFLRYHHAWLIITLNLGMVLFFLPGHPSLWLLMGWLSFSISVVQYILNRRLKFLSVPSVTRSLIFLAVVVIATAKATGGIGVMALGSETLGGKRYIMLLSSIVVYFALTAQAIPPGRAYTYIVLFFLTSISHAVGDMAPLLGPGMMYVFLLFPVSTQGAQYLSGEMAAGSGLMERLGGLAVASTGVICALLVKYGIAELFTFRRIGKFLIFASAVALSMLGGYRSTLILIVLTFASVFVFEGLVRSRLMPVLVCLTFFGAVLTLPFLQDLPLTMQRTLSFLPVKVDPLARMSAEDTTEWRLNMWKHLLPQIPQYLIVGKGYGFNLKDAQMSLMANHGGEDTSATELVGDYHNGPLSVILPFGLFGTFAFLWFLTASLKVLYQNYAYGHPFFHRINTFLLGYFCARILFFFLIFGSFYLDMLYFTSIVGLSVSMNRGVARPFTIPPHARARVLPFRLRPIAQGA